jgi:hypothetical protein
MDHLNRHFGSRFAYNLSVNCHYSDRGTAIPHKNGGEPFNIFAQLVSKFCRTFQDMTFAGDPVVSKVHLVN